MACRFGDEVIVGEGGLERVAEKVRSLVPFVSAHCFFSWCVCDWRNAFLGALYLIDTLRLCDGQPWLEGCVA
jgi:hypothetical protein